MWTPADLLRHRMDLHSRPPVCCWIAAVVAAAAASAPPCCAVMFHYNLDNRLAPVGPPVPFRPMHDHRLTVAVGARW
uniref:Putative secreted protein n=1 Tax=Anopheles darlingi TaxID=43151 RepID=A0A2M4DKL8_ANODA